MSAFILKNLAGRVLAGLLITAVAGVLLSGAWKDYLANIGPAGMEQRKLERDQRRTERTIERGGRGAREARRELRSRQRKLDPRRSAERALDEGASLRSRIANRVWRAVRLPAAVLALLAVALSVSRYRARKARRYRRYWLLPYRGD